MNERTAVSHVQISRRQFVVMAGVTALSAGALVAHAGDAEEATSQDADDGEVIASQSAGPDSSAASDAGGAGNGILVAYFSATGHTEGIANIIAQYTGADVFVMEPAEPYSDDDLRYSDPESRVSREHDDLDNTHVELVETTPEGFDDYDVVFLGFPLWWGHASWVINDFVASNDFEGKTIVPFCTSASSGYGDNTEYLQSMATSGTWVEGSRFSSGASEQEVQEWIDSLDLGVAEAQQDDPAGQAEQQPADEDQASEA